VRVRTKKLAPVGLATSLLLLLAACAHTAIPQDTLNPAGPEARTIDGLFWPVFWIAVGVFVLVEGLLVIALFRFRTRPGRGVPKQVHGNTRLEITWTIIPLALLIGVAAPTLKTIFDLARKPANALQISVVGHQWWWEVRYPSLHVSTANEIHIPVGTPVYVTLTSGSSGSVGEAVIHSFWVPRLAGKQDLEPGRINHLTIQADAPGTYLGQCVEYCGFSHANMRLRVMAQSPADFRAWAAAEAKPAAAPPTGSLAEQGASMFVDGAGGGAFANGPACSACHTVQGLQGAGGIVGPNLTHFAERTTFAGATFDNIPANLRAWLDDPGALKPGVDMPDLGLTPDQIGALIAYLESLK
jgi:cytochrome c oxidase subunit 2